jgi:hypothetical protein
MLPRNRLLKDLRDSFILRDKAAAAEDRARAHRGVDLEKKTRRVTKARRQASQSNINIRGVRRV